VTRRVAVLTGGVGGAKLVHGLLQIMPAENITAIVNTGDDFQHLGLHISPDIDTVLYTLSGKANRVQGWGREDESWNFMEALRELGDEDWFALGDRDLALHVVRSYRLAQGDSLTAITRDCSMAWGIGAIILPMSDNRVATFLDTDEGLLEFQRYFVESRCAPIVKQVIFRGSENAKAAPGVVDALYAADIVLLAPSNPYLSIDPLLSVPEINTALHSLRAPVVSVSPIIGGRAVKGPTAKLMKELGKDVDNSSIAAHYAGLINGLLIDSGDEAPSGIQVAKTDTLMRSHFDRARVAEAACDFAYSLGTK